MKLSDYAKNLGMEYMWLLPGDEFNHLVGTTIRPSTIHKWDKYKQPIDGVVACCDEMKAH